MLGAAGVIHGLNGGAITEIITIAVRKEYQQQNYGYGTMLVHSIAEQALARGDKTITLHCFDEEVMTGFYQKFGFTPLEEIEPDYVSVDTAGLLTRTAA